ncbi:DUF3800 domain-containing protein [Enterocloster hominis (ex Hitch et al. 2024)]|uniref:DUF3800 domain-containing protein n=1 Tax=Enterocloster hominis (ex Hitch et al. 2024) TaxID=1917870 RepID=A0ABV1D0A6_9FIRM
MIFMDESGHTGTQRFNDGKWNINGQSYFVLAAFKLDGTMIDLVERELDILIKKYRIQSELKSTGKVVKNNLLNLSNDIEAMLNKVNGEIHIEIVNKRYCIAMQIVNYCILPYYDLPPDDIRATIIKPLFANYLYLHLDDETLGKFVEFFDSNRKNVRELSTMCGMLFGMIKHSQVKKSISDTMETIRKYKKMGIQLNNLFPLEDRYRGGKSTVSVCPHIDSFNNIVMYYPNEKNFIHDEIKDIDNALKENIKTICELYKREMNLDFDKSVNNACLQIADFFAGNIRVYIEKVFAHEESNDTPELFKKIVECNTNFVAPYHEQCAILSQNDGLKALMDWYNDWAKM